MDGWVKIHRKIRDNWIWDNPDYLKAWLDLIFRANFEERRILFDGEVKELKCGQFVTSIRKLAEAWCWSNSRVLNFLRMLEADGMIKRDSNAKRTLLTIENYEFYQVQQNSDENTDKNASQSQKRSKEEKKNNTPSDKDYDAEKRKEEALKHNFAYIYQFYPKKEGRTEAFRRYTAWVTTGRKVNKKMVKLTNEQILAAVKKYVDEQEAKGTEMQFYKNFSTFMGNVILDYVDEESGEE